MRWPSLSPELREVGIVILGFAFVGMLLLLSQVFFSADQASTSYGFGPEWTCTNQGDGGPICTKNVSGKSPNQDTPTRRATSKD
jgi:hypothetical protein